MLATQRDRRQPDRDAHRDDPAHPRRDQRGGEKRREEKQRRHACEHEDESGKLVARELSQELVHEPTIVKRAPGAGPEGSMRAYSFAGRLAITNRPSSEST